MKIAVITALYYEDRFLPSLFASLEAVDYPREDWEIIMIDNRDSIITREWVEKNALPKCGTALPRFTLIESRENRGFAGGNNACIERALAGGAEAVYLLNEDARLDPACLKNSAARLARDPKAGAVQSLLLLDPPERGVNSLGNALHYLGFSYCGNYLMSRQDAMGYLRVRYLGDRDLTIAAASGAASLIRASALAEAGVFDENYRLYHEDLDLSLRLRESGWKLVLEPTALAYHQYEFSRSAEKFYWMERNRYRLVLEHYKLGTLLLLAPALILSELGLLALSLFNGTALARLRVWGYLLDMRNWKEIADKRESVQAKRKIKDRELLGSAVSALRYQEKSAGAGVALANALLALYWKAVKPLIAW